MAAFTSIAFGNWNQGGVWVAWHADPQVEGTDYPGNADTFVVANTHTVTVNGVYPAAGALGAGTVNAGGILTHSTNVNTKLTLGAASLTVAGTYTMGAVGADIDADKLCELSFTPASAGGNGLIISAGGTFNSCGDTKDYFKLLASDVGEWAASNDIATVANVTSIDLDSAPTGWRDNDVLVVAAMGRTAGHSDTCLVNEDPVAGTAIAVDSWQGAAPTYVGAGTKSAWNHQGAGTPTQARAEVVNLTRNVRIYSTHATNTAYIVFETTATVSMNYTECRYLGTNTADKYGITTKTTTGSVALTGVMVHDSYCGYWIQETVSTGTVSISNCGSFATTAISTGYAVLRIAAAVSGAGSISVNGMVGIKCGIGYPNPVSIGGITGITVTNLRLADAPNAVSVAFGASLAWIPGSHLSNVVIHSFGGTILAVASDAWTIASSPLRAFTIYRCNAPFLSAGAKTLHFSGLVFFGNGTISGISYTSTAQIAQYGGGTLHLDATCSNPGDSVAAWDAGIDLMADGGEIYANGATIRNYQGARRGGKLFLNNVTWNSIDGYLLGGDGDALDTSISIWRYNGAEDDHRWRTERMEVRTETGADRRTASGMAYEFWPLLNTSWTRPPRDLRFRVPAVADTPITVKVWTKHNAAYDETHPERLVIVGGGLQGVTPIGPQACTVTDAGDTVDDVGHGMVNGTEVIFDSTANGLTRGIIYYVVAAAANTFQVAATAGGAAVPITSNGTNTYTARDVVGSAHSAADDSYEELTSATVTPTESGGLEYYIQCYGTTGTVWSDDPTFH